MVIGNMLVAYVKICEYFGSQMLPLNELLYIAEQNVARIC